MKKLMLLCIILLISANAFAMGERVERPKTENGTPIFETAAAQLTFAQQKLASLETLSVTANVKPTALAFYDYRKLFSKDTDNVVRSYFYEAKSYYLGNEFNKFNEVYAQFIEKNASANTLTDLQAEGSVMIGKSLMKQGDYLAALTVLEKIEKDLPMEKKQIIEARREQFNCLQALGHVSESITILEDTLKNYSVSEYDQAFFELNIGLSYQKIGDMPNAIEAFQRVIALPETPKNKGPKLAAKLMYETLQKAQ